MTDLELDPGSFRDRDSRVFTSGGEVFRALSDRGLDGWRQLRDSGLLEPLITDGKLVATEELSAHVDGYAALLRHEPVPFVSYPYEWTFSMLKDAALLQLELLLAALDKGLTLKDASPYNVQWRGARPVFIDVGSFERLREGEPWAGYRQFCMQFLYPLLLQAYKDVDFRPLLRGRLDGITPRQCRRFLSLLDLARPGVLTHVVLHARLEERHADRHRDVKSELRGAGFGTELVRANARRLQRLVRRLEWRPRSSEWSAYGPTTSYTAADAERKAGFVRQAMGGDEWRLVWDLGCNDGRHARIAAGHARCVVALDGDPVVVDRLYRDLAGDGTGNVLPLAVDLADASPALGWRGRERKALEDRGRPDLVLCLAFVHHLSIGANVPIREVVDWLASLRATVVVEFPTRDDEMVRRLLAAKQPGANADYELGVFERALKEMFDVERREKLAAGTRVLYVARPKR